MPQSILECSTAKSIDCVEVGIGFDKKLHVAEVATCCCEVQCCTAIIVSIVDGDTILDQLAHLLNSIVEGILAEEYPNVSLWE